MRLAIKHTTRYQYENEIQPSTQFLRLTPHNTQRQKVINWQVSLLGDTTKVTDGFGNTLHVAILDEPNNVLSIEVNGEIEILENIKEDLNEQLSPFEYLKQTYLTKPNTALEKFSDTHLKKPLSLHGIYDFMQQLLLRMTYTPNKEMVHYSAQQAFDIGTGVCQDLTHVFLSCCRYRGLPARYVSGYLYNPETLHVSSHAWAEIWLNGHWHTCDISSGLTSPSKHIKLAVGLDFLDACPVRGVRSCGGNEAMSALTSVAHIIDS